MSHCVTFVIGLMRSPGQIELYTHIPVMRQIVEQLQRWNFRLCGVFLLDSQFLIETSKFFAGMMTALSSMVTLELPHVNVLSKVDLLDKRAKKEMERCGREGGREGGIDRSIDRLIDSPPFLTSLPFSPPPITLSHLPPSPCHSSPFTLSLC